jgi:hypothetical protein
MMRKILAILIIFVLIAPVVAEEVTVDVSRIALLNPPQNETDTESDRIAVYFNLPEEVEGNRILYAEIVANLDFSNVDIAGETKLELQAYNITEDWSSDNPAWNALADDIDTLSFYTYTFDMSAESAVHMDVTPFVEDITGGRVDNFGLMLIPHKLDQWAFQINQRIVSQIQEHAQLRIVYQ